MLMGGVGRAAASLLSKDAGWIERRVTQHVRVQAMVGRAKAWPWRNDKFFDRVVASLA
jgi:homoserine dehydrogenase